MRRRGRGKDVRPRKAKTTHPGVTIIRPNEASRRVAWGLRWVDPDTGKTKKTRLDPDVYTTAKHRLRAAEALSRQIVQRKAELERGAVRMTGSTVAAEVERYFKDHAHLREKTLRTYRDAASKLVAWCEGSGVESVDGLDRSQLLAFRASLIAEPKRGERKGLPRGMAAPTTERRSAHTVNRELRAVGTVLNYLRKAGRLPRLDSDDIADGLERLRAPREPIAFLRAPEIARVLEAALAHDADGEARAPIAPAVLGALTTGMRLGELVRVTWRDVDLEAKGESGESVGEIVIRGAESKTGIGRVVDLSVSPKLRELLEVMRPSDPKGLDAPVFGVTYDEATAAGKRLAKAYEAPEGFSWQACRRTCGTFLTNAPGIFGAASAYRSARQLGHSVSVAERNYLGVVRGIAPEARTLEAAMQIEGLAERIVASARARTGKTESGKVIPLKRARRAAR